MQILFTAISSQQKMLHKHPVEWKIIIIPNFSPVPLSVKSASPTGRPDSFGKVSNLRHYKYCLYEYPGTEPKLSIF